MQSPPRPLVSPKHRVPSSKVFTLHEHSHTQDVFALQKTPTGSFAIVGFKYLEDARKVSLRIGAQKKHMQNYPSFILQNNTLMTSEVPLRNVQDSTITKEWDDLNHLCAYSYIHGFLLMLVSSIYITPDQKIVLYNDFISFNVDKQLIYDVLESRLQL